MLIVFGFRIRFKPTEAVVFFCPQCGGDRHGTRMLGRRWFTIFFIPVLPLGIVGDLVRCDSCRTQLHPSVLDRPTTAGLATVLANATRVLAVMVVGAGDRHHDAMRAAAVRSIREVEPEYDDDTLHSDLEVVIPTQAEEYVLPLADGLEVAGKERFVGDLTRIALAGGTITANQRWLLDTVGRGLRLTPVHVTGIVSSVVAERSDAGPTPPPPASDPPAVPPA